MAMDYSDLNYFKEASSSIEAVQRLANGVGHQVQLNLFQCQFLAAKLTETGSFLKAKADPLKDIPGRDDIRRKALRQLHFTVKRAEKLLRSCCCEVESSWVESAVTLAQIREDIVDILLDLRWWTSMVEIAIASATWVASGKKIELELLECAEADFQSLLTHLHSRSNDLDEAVAKDNEQLLKRLQELQKSYAGNKPNDPQQNREFLLAAHVRARLENTHLETADEVLNANEHVGFIGQGSFGAVVKVKWFGRNCALKMLKYKCMKEATSLSAFQHPHIVQFFRYWEAAYNATLDDTQDSTPYDTPNRPSDTTFSNPTQNLAADTSMESSDTLTNLKSHILMELLPTDLAKHMETLAMRAGSKRTHSGAPASEPMPQEVAIDVMLQVAKAMWHLNNKEVAHRDLKPSNVLVRPVSPDEAPELASRGYVRVKLGDFGLAKTKAMSSAYSTQTGMVGTKVYGAPEVFTQETFSVKKFPRKADVWSFGIMFCEVLSGKPPFPVEENPIGQLQAKIRKGTRPELPKNCPDYLKFCITNCWQKRPQDRPSFPDLWRMVRLAQVRSLGIIRENHDLFTFTPRDHAVRRLHAPDKDLKPSSFWFLFWRITFLFARRRDPSNQSNPNYTRQRSRAVASLARSEDKPLGYLVNPVGPLDSTSDNSKLDVIFFEGNVGRRKYLSCKDTWVQRGKLDVWWPRDWLLKDFKGDIRVLLLEYSISEAGVEGVVDELQRLLVFSDRWNREHTWQRPIVLVGHSLGCVVIEQLVVALDQRAKSVDTLTDDFDISRAKVSKAFLASLAGCFFYAPPYTGLVPSEELLKYVFGGLSYSQALFADLCLDSSALKELSVDFMQARSKRFKLMALIEGFHTRGRTVVPPASMREFEQSGGNVEELQDSNHSDTCKPTNKEHPAYRLLVEFIGEVLNEKKVAQNRSGDKRPAVMVS